MRIVSTEWKINLPNRTNCSTSRTSCVPFLKRLDDDDDDDDDDDHDDDDND